MKGNIISRGICGMTELNPMLLALRGHRRHFAATVIGSAVVFFFSLGDQSKKIQRVFLGFAAGIMIAASVWSLLIPSIEMAEEQGRYWLIPAAGGFALSGLFLFALDHLLPPPAYWQR